MIKYILDVKTVDRNFKAYLYRKEYLTDDEIEQEKIQFCKEIREMYDKSKSNIDVLEVGIKVVE
jgi:hypothetical protein|nr:MAG TPA: hypothetical protein [Caudoviricetes sp.]